MAASATPYREGVNQRPTSLDRAGMEQVVADFVEWARGTPATPEEEALVNTAVEQVRLQEGMR